MKVQVGNLKLIDVWWFTGRDSVGIVLCEDVITKKQKAYIGVVKGYNEHTDVINLIEWGSKFPLGIAQQMLNK